MLPFTGSRDFYCPFFPFHSPCLPVQLCFPLNLPVAKLAARVSFPSLSSFPSPPSSTFTPKIIAHFQIQ